MSKYVAKRWIDLGLNKAFERLESIATQKPAIKFGLFAAGKKDTSHPNIGFEHEFGARRASTDLGADIPARPWLRPSFFQNLSKYESFLRKGLGAVLTGRAELLSVFNQLGETAANDQRETIKRGVPPPNKPYTLERKNGSTPLVDTGLMMRSVKHRIVFGKKAEKET